jgi:hypothetical protein
MGYVRPPTARSAAEHLAISTLVVTITLAAASASALAPIPTATPTPVHTDCIESIQPRGPACCYFQCPETDDACVPGEGGAGCFSVTAPADCCWTASLSSSGYQNANLTEGAEGCGSGRVCYEIGPFFGLTQRTHRLRIGSEILSIGQDHAGTPTPVPCTPVPPAQLEFDFAVDPPQPVVGDPVRVTVTIRNVSSGLAGLPQYALYGEAPFLEGDPPPIVHYLSLGTDRVTFDLRAAHAGTAALKLGVSYETNSGCEGEFPVYGFTGTTSEPYYFRIREPGSSAEECTGDCDHSGAVTIEEITAMVGLARGDAAPPCAPGDGDRDGRITIDEILAAVNNALTGCLNVRCGPIPGLKDCETDDECIVVSGTGCCTCQMGGEQEAINRDHEIALAGRLAACCDDISCLAVYQCETGLNARCAAGTCILLRPPTPTTSPTPTRSPGGAELRVCHDSADCNPPLWCVPESGGGICFAGPRCAGFAGFSCPAGLVCLAPKECCDLSGACVTRGEAAEICQDQAGDFFDCGGG